MARRYGLMKFEEQGIFLLFGNFIKKIDGNVIYRVYPFVVKHALV